ncbi:MAG TPA: Hsp20/alpha crystallin family protein [Usitatibacter sp.]|nr:Hsp20/alpha crystallin family protein [Usitatibacter sp.]
MANITRFDPFKELARIDPFGEGWPRLMRRWLPETAAEPTIRIDVTEDDKAFHVKAEMPGVKKEDIEIQVDGNEVSLCAQVKRETEEKKGETVVHSERFYGRQYRSFTLGKNIDRAKAEAKFADGVLDLTLPKADAPRGEKIAVQ